MISDKINCKEQVAVKGDSNLKIDFMDGITYVRPKRKKA